MPLDPTFTAYTPTQAQTYAQHRLSYPFKLYDIILKHHTNTGGKLNVLADAHWFSMPSFWVQAAQVVKPNVTVALWTCSSLYCHPSTSNAAAVKKAFFHLERDILAPYELPPNQISRNRYDNLILPWQVNDLIARYILAESFPEKDFVRLEWDRDGILTNGEDFFLASKDENNGETH
ncbi:hypothetical protein PMAA_077950 [Talaromyces marneffei ATCC 18224]|uniref:Uncharacterized protein n=1 Tax=Talaromyces marneffei (strain ATCC 18224 / CBS 334.59 / QM 7333) TaxID=441960 RepID=B6QDB6_TALMQ|nr:hypothetical protein PMAA_077950 [Talaromyces marneffei ATCC 18224]